MYRGQFLDDKTIEEYFGADYVGGCIDVGSTNGVDINNTMHFEENGWYCLCIEPNPESFEKLKINRKNAINVAVSDYNKDLVDFTVVNLNNDASERESAISSLIIDNKLYQDHLDLGFNLTTKNIKVSTRTLNYCIENYYTYDKIDFLDIDTEGTELDVLKGFDINKWQPKLMVIENNYEKLDVEQYLTQFGYIKDKRVGVNDYYIKYKKKKFLLHPKLGDFLHSLYAVKCLSGKFKSDIYIKDEKVEGFLFGIENTYNDMFSVIKSQPYIDNFFLYDESVVDIIDINFLDVNYLFKRNWYEVYQKIFNITNKFENEPWIYGINNDNICGCENKTVIHFSLTRYNNSFDELLKDIVKNNDCIFVSNNIKEYDNFKFKNLLEFKKCDSFLELFAIIEKCRFFIGNQSMPLAIAHGLFKPHMGFLCSVDAVHYKDDFNENYFWFDDQKNYSSGFDNISEFVNIKNKLPEPIKKIDFNNIIFKIKWQDNLILIFCNYKISLYVIIFKYNIITNEKNTIYSTLSNFDNNTIWYSPEKGLDGIGYVKIEISYNENIIKEEILNIL